MHWLQSIIDTVRREGACARIVIIATDGPTPRAIGASMLVWRNGSSGKIGRGPIETAAVLHARQMLARSVGHGNGHPAWHRERLSLRTGEVLGESTGGSIDLLVEVFGAAEAAVLERLAELSASDVLVRPLDSGAPIELAGEHERARALPAGRTLELITVGRTRVLAERTVPSRLAFHVYGTGVVARALVACLAGLPFEVIWLDRAPGHFPADVPSGVAHAAHADLVEPARTAPAGALHAVMTADHDLDMRICKALLEAGSFAYLGVIGSRLKRERLEARLVADGIDRRALDRLSCPIGIAQIRSKDPAVMAISIAAEALSKTAVEL